MAKYRHALPQLNHELFLSDAGMETTLIFHDGFELPHFAAFDLLKSESGREALTRYFKTYIDLARKYELGLILESATWRASSDWANKLGYSETELNQINHQAIDLLADLRRSYETEQTKIVISGCIGPRDDAYSPTKLMTVAEAEIYHAKQIQTFRDTDADMISAVTMTYLEEAIAVTRAARLAEMPVVISFTVETNGHLPSGQPLKDAIEMLDAETNSAPVYYMINCAHPTHFANGVKSQEEIRIC